MFTEETVRGERLSEYGSMYPSVGKYVLTRIVDLYSPEGTDEIYMEVDVPEPNNDGIWIFDYPYSWNTEADESLPNMADELGYNRNNFYEMVGEPVLVKPDDTNDLNVLVVNRAEDRIHDLYEHGEIHISEIDVDAIDEHFDVNLPFKVPDDEEILFKGDKAGNLVDSVR